MTNKNADVCWIVDMTKTEGSATVKTAQQPPSPPRALFVCMADAMWKRETRAFVTGL